jgi:hypothetical protein
MKKEKIMEVIKEVATLVLVITLSCCIINLWNSTKIDTDTKIEYDTDENLNF